MKQKFKRIDRELHEKYDEYPTSGYEKLVKIGNTVRDLRNSNVRVLYKDNYYEVHPSKVIEMGWYKFIDIDDLGKIIGRYKKDTK